MFDNWRSHLILQKFAALHGYLAFARSDCLGARCIFSTFSSSCSVVSCLVEPRWHSSFMYVLLLRIVVALVDCPRLTVVTANVTVAHGIFSCIFNTLSLWSFSLLDILSELVEKNHFEFVGMPIQEVIIVYFLDSVLIVVLYVVQHFFRAFDFIFVSVLNRSFTRDVFLRIQCPVMDITFVSV